MSSNVDWKSYIPWATTAILGSYAVYTIFNKKCSHCVNHSVQKDVPKVVHAFDIEDLGEKTAFCRCWQSKKFPHCDGSHSAHNKLTGDNVGPVVIQNRS